MIHSKQEASLWPPLQAIKLRPCTLWTRSSYPENLRRGSTSGGRRWPLCISEVWPDFSFLGQVIKSWHRSAAKLPLFQEWNSGGICQVLTVESSFIGCWYFSPGRQIQIKFVAKGYNPKSQASLQIFPLCFQWLHHTQQQQEPTFSPWSKPKILLGSQSDIACWDI